MHFRQRITAIAVAVLLGIGLSVAIAGPAAAVPVGPYRLKVPGYNVCLDIQGVSYDNGAPAQLYDCLPNQWNQAFYMYQNPNNPQQYQIVAAHSSKCLDVVGVSPYYGAGVQQYTCLGWSQLNQVWALYNGPRGWKWLAAQHSGMCLAFNGWVANGAEVVQKSCNEYEWDIVYF